MKKTIVLEKSYEVERIVKMKEEDGKRFFRIKWVGWPHQSNTWEPEEHLPVPLVSEFLQETEKHAERKKKKREPALRDSYRPEAPEKKIVDMRQDSERICFVVMNGKRKEVHTREDLLRQEPELLARYYLRVYCRAITHDQ